MRCPIDRSILRLDTKRHKNHTSQTVFGHRIIVFGCLLIPLDTSIAICLYRFWMILECNVLHWCSVSYVFSLTSGHGHGLFQLPFLQDSCPLPRSFRAPSSAAMKTTTIPRGSGRLGGESGTLAFGLCGDSAAETNSGAWWGLNSNLAQCFVFVLPSAKFASIKCHQVSPKHVLL